MSNLYEDHARERAGITEEWHLASWEMLDFDPATPTGKDSDRMRCTFWKAPKLASGEIAWKYKEKGSKRTVTMTLGDHRAWVIQWETRTGRCHKCHKDHPGQEWVGWNHETGHRFQECRACKGSNKPSLVA